MNKQSTPKISPEAKKTLRAKHRMELVMQEMGERFERDKKHPEIWISLATPGLMVNTQRQVFDLPNAQGGDVFTWLMQRNGWTFPQAIRYLQKRIPDPLEESLPQAETPTNTIYKLKKYESEELDFEKENSGLYTCGVKWVDGKKTYYYLPNPINRKQKRALEIGGEKIRDYFSWGAEPLVFLRDSIYQRFTPIQDASATVCEECGERIQWRWKHKPQFGYEFLNGGRERRKVRLPQSEVFAYAVMDGESEIIICEDCKRKLQDFYEALDLLYESACEQEISERERSPQKKEIEHVFKTQ